MTELLKILDSIKEGIDFEHAVNLVDDGILDSIEIVTIICEIEEQFGIEIAPDEIEPENFQSARAIWEMIYPGRK